MLSKLINERKRIGKEETTTCEYLDLLLTRPCDRDAFRSWFQGPNCNIVGWLPVAWDNISRTLATLSPVRSNFSNHHAHSRLAERSTRWLLDLSIAAIIANMNRADERSTIPSVWHAFPFLFDDSTLDSPRESIVLHFTSLLYTDMAPPMTIGEREICRRCHSMLFLRRLPASTVPSDPGQWL